MDRNRPGMYPQSTRFDGLNKYHHISRFDGGPVSGYYHDRQRNGYEHDPRYSDDTQIISNGPLRTSINSMGYQEEVEADENQYDPRHSGYTQVASNGLLRTSINSMGYQEQVDANDQLDPQNSRYTNDVSMEPVRTSINSMGYQDEFPVEVISDGDHVHGTSYDSSNQMNFNTGTSNRVFDSDVIGDSEKQDFAHGTTYLGDNDDMYSYSGYQFASFGTAPKDTGYLDESTLVSAASCQHNSQGVGFDDNLTTVIDDNPLDYNTYESVQDPPPRAKRRGSISSIAYKTIVKRLVDRAASVHEYVSKHDVAPGWDSKWGHKTARVLFLRLPIPLLLVLAALALPAFTGYLYIGDPPAFDISLASFTVPTHDVALKADAVFAAGNKCSGVECVNEFCPGERRRRRQAHRWHQASDASGIRWNLHMDDVDAAPAAPLGVDGLSARGSYFDHLQYGGIWEDFLGSRSSASRKGSFRQRRDLLKISLVYHSLDGNMITPKNVLAMQRIENTLAEFGVEQGYEPSFNSLSAFFFPPGGQYGQPAVEPTQAQVTSSMNVAYRGSGGQPGTTYPSSLGSTATAAYASQDLVQQEGVWSAAYLRAEITGIGDSSTANVEAWVNVLESANTESSVDFIFASEEIFGIQIMNMLYADAYYAMYALIFVVSFMLFHTGSLFLTLMGLLNTIGAFPVGYAVYRECFGVKNLSILTVVTLFIVIGIAVDDVFVFIDMFRQQDRKVGLEERMIRTMSTAARATLFTTITSASAFAANTLSEIPALSNFGLLTALVISANYVLLVLLIPPVLGFWWKYIEPTEAKVLAAIMRVCCCPCAFLWQRRPGHRARANDTSSTADNASTASDHPGDDLQHKRSKGPGRKKDSGRAPAPAPDDDFVPFLLPGQTAPVDSSHADEYPDVVPRMETEARGRAPPRYIKAPSWTDNDDSASLDGPGLYHDQSTTARGQFDTYGHGTASHAHDVPRARQRRAKSFRTTGAKVDPLRATAQAKPRVHTADARQAIDRRESSASLFEQVLYHVVGTVSVRGRWFILVGFVCVFAVSCQQATLLQPADEPPSLVAKDSNIGKVQQLSSEFANWDASGGNLQEDSGNANNNVNVNDGGPVTAPPTPSRAPTLPPAPTFAPTKSPTSAAPTSTVAPTVAVSVAPTSAAPTVTPPTFAPVGAEASQSANAEITLIFGLARPWVDRSLADTAAFTEPRDDYLPVFAETFNTAQPVYVDGIGAELQAEYIAFCSDLLDDTAVVLANQSGTTVCTPARAGYKYQDCTQPTATVVLWFEMLIKGLFDANTGAQAVIDQYNAMEAVLAKARVDYPELVTVEQSALDYERAFYEQIAIDGSIMGIIASLVLCFMAVVLFKAHVTVIFIAMTIILGNVAIIVAAFYWSGWTLGGVEAVSLSILVGTCVDYCIHMIEGYLEANPDHRQGLREQSLKTLLQVQSNADLRCWRVRQAIASVGVPVVSSALTTAGSAAFLTLCNLQLMKRFGEILVLNTCVSIILTLTALPAMLAIMGPATFKGSIKRFVLACLFLGFIYLMYYAYTELSAKYDALVNG